MIHHSTRVVLKCSSECTRNTFRDFEYKMILLPYVLLLLRSVTATMGDDTPDNVEEVGRSADGKPAGAEGGGNEYKNEEKN